MRVQIVIFNGFDELDAIAPFEVLQNAAAAGADVQVELVTLDGSEHVVAAHGLHVQPDKRLAFENRPDLLIVTGGGWINRSPQGAWAEAQRGELPAAIARLHQEGTTIAAVCTGSMLVAKAGLIQDRPATTHHGALEELRACGTKVIDARVVDDGDLITAGGVTSGLDLALWMVERFFGAQIALAVENELQYERRGIVWRR
jgi:transcriptional regulator GlxA family with amidase domain